MKNILIYGWVVCLLSGSLTIVKASDDEVKSDIMTTVEDNEKTNKIIDNDQENSDSLINDVKIEELVDSIYTFSLNYNIDLIKTIDVVTMVDGIEHAKFPMLLDKNGIATISINNSSFDFDNNDVYSVQVVVHTIEGLEKAYDISSIMQIKNDDNLSINDQQSNEGIKDKGSNVDKEIEDTKVEDFNKMPNRESIHKPSISNVRVDNITNDTYTIKATITDECGISNVKIPTWTLSNGQDDIVWGEAFIEGSEITYVVNMKDHAYEAGTYVSNIYAYDNSQNYSAIDVPLQNLYKTAPTIKDVSIISLSSGSYKITAKVNDYRGIDKIMFPTWTIKDGQDDITWGRGTIYNDIVTYIVDIKDHDFETGDYITNIYAYNIDGMYSAIDVPIQSLSSQKPEIKDIEIKQLNSGSYKITAQVEADYGINYVLFPTWTIKNGQDDITWGKGVITGNTVSYIVDMEEHGFEAGEYLTNIYAYDKSGAYSAVAVPIQQLVNTEKPTITDLQVINNKAGKYTIKATVTDDYKISKVLFPTWTIKNGQDDIVWGEGIRDGNTFTYSVDFKDHKYEVGSYLSNIYAYDAEGNYSALAVPIQMIENKSPEIKNARIVDISAGYYTIEAEIYDDYGIDKVLFPTWTIKNGQDDITWGGGMIEGNKVTYRVWIDYHNNEVGNYKTEIYAYDKAGAYTAISLPIQNIVNNKPEIGTISISNRHAGGYTITAEIKDDYKIDKVLFPTWTIENGQDDIVWGEGRLVNGLYTYDVLIDNHDYELGPYLSNIFVYDITGEYTAISIDMQTVKNNPPVISNYYISDVDSTGYTVNATISDDYKLDKVLVPTWTIKNGQDDITWGEASEIGNHKYTYRVNVNEHGFESGMYLSNLYAYDSSGNYQAVSLPTVELDVKLTPGWQVIHGKKYLFDRDGIVVNGATKAVIDISEHNGDIDWVKVKNSGVDYVILRAGYGWADDLNAQIDNKFIKNAQELERLGIPYGIYLFSYANDVAGAKKEAEYTLRLMQGRKISLPVYYDLEYSNYAGDISASTYTAMANAYCNIIQQAGYRPGIYANLNYWNTKLYDSSLDKYEKWVAQYNSNDGSVGHCDYNKNYSMWQYTSVGSVPGIKGNVDMNAWY